ncbi:MAG: agmatinase [Patescibacteria group bacterium]
MKKNFLDLEEKFSDFKKSKIVVVSFPFEKTSSYFKGTRFGPEKIIEASWQVELFDEELWFAPYKVGISTLRMKPSKIHKKALNQLEKKIEKILNLKKFPIILGGEHSITIGSLKAILKKFQKFTLLQFDAHLDLRDSWLGSRLSHAAVMRRCLEFDKNINLVQIGIRNVSEEEKLFLEKNKNRIKTFFAKDKKKWQKNKILKFCQKNVFLTFDFDVLDSSIMPSVGTPEPGGLDWNEILNLLKMICQKRKIITADFIEFCPIKGLIAPDFLAAKLIYKFIGYLVKYNL